MNDLRLHLICGLECNGALLTMPWPVAPTSPCLHSSYKKTFWLFTVTKI